MTSRAYQYKDIKSTNYPKTKQAKWPIEKCETDQLAELHRRDIVIHILTQNKVINYLSSSQGVYRPIRTINF